MAQDIRDLVQQNKQLEKIDMPKGHEGRFIKKLEKEFPLPKTKSKFTFLNIAATIVLLFGLTFGGFKIFNSDKPDTIIPNDEPLVVETKSLKDVSPQLKKVEDYYLASINYELSKMKVTPESLDLMN